MNAAPCMLSWRKMNSGECSFVNISIAWEIFMRNGASVFLILRHLLRKHCWIV